MLHFSRASYVRTTSASAAHMQWLRSRTISEHHGSTYVEKYYLPLAQSECRTAGRESAWVASKQIGLQLFEIKLCIGNLMNIQYTHVGTVLHRRHFRTRICRIIYYMILNRRRFQGILDSIAHNEYAPRPLHNVSIVHATRRGLRLRGTASKQRT
jgi:hypothetical protein